MSKVKQLNLTPRILMHHLASRNNLQFLDAHSLDKGATDDYYMYAINGRDPDSVYVWHVAFDFEGELLMATELFVFNPENAPARIPDPVLLEALRVRKRDQEPDMDRYREGELQWPR